MAKLLAIGNGTVDVLVKPIEKLDFSIDSNALESLVMTSGGDTMNVTVNMTRLGMDVDMMAIMSDDNFGKFLMRRLSEIGAGTDRIKVVPGGKGSVTLVVINSKGDRSFYSVKNSVNKAIGVDDLDFTCFGEYDFLLYNNIFVLPNLLGDSAKKVFSEGKRAGCVTIGDTSWDRRGEWLGDKGIGGALPYIDYFMPSFVEARAMTGAEKPEDMAAYLLARGAKNVGIKLGGDGSFFMNANERFYTPAYVIDPVDTTGAGDAFISGFTTALMRGMDHRDACRLAGAMGAYACTFIGTTTNCPTTDEIARFMRETPVRPL